MTRVLWFDPGGVTGAAWATVEKGRPIVEQVRIGLEECDDARKQGGGEHSGGVCQIPVGCGEPYESRGAWAMMMLIADVEPDIVGMEDFRLFPNERHSPDQKGTIPMRLLAKVDQMFWMAQQPDLGVGDLSGVDAVLPRLVKQMPGERLSVTTAQLRKWGLWRTPKNGGGKDAMAAMQHLLVFLRKGKW